MESAEQAERTSAVERLCTVARADARGGPEGAQELDHALGFLRELERELARPDSMIAGRGQGTGTGLAAFLGSRYATTFHWVHVGRITAPEHPVSGRSAHRVAFVVRRDGTDVELGFPLERAKVAWTRRSYLENKPLEAVLSGLQGLRHIWSLPALGARAGHDEEVTSERLRLLSGAEQIAGTRYGQEVLDWELEPRAPLELRGAAAARQEQALLAAVVVAMGFGCVLVPLLLSRLTG